MSNLKVLVVGASIAGPMSAYWLAKAGANVTIIERVPELRTGGQNVDIRTTGLTVMRKIPGMEDTVRANLAPVEGLAFVREDGSVIGAITSSGNVEQQSLVSEYEIYRGKLSQIIVDLTKNNDRVKYIFNEQIASIQQPSTDGPVTVEFANGTPTQEFDLVVACDGATSRTRALGLGCSVRDYYHPVGAWVAYWSIPRDILEGGKIGHGFNAPGGRAIALKADPSGTNRVMAWNSHSTPDDSVLKELREVQRLGTEELKEFVARRYKGMGWVTEECLAGLNKANDFYASEWAQVKAPVLYKGRFVMVGDAGYASGPSGAGTSLAMGGAYVLAGEINNCKGDIAAGLQAYEDRMRPIIKDMQTLPPGILTILAPQTAWGISVRNTIFQAVCWTLKFGSLFWWFSSFFTSSFGKDKYNLPDYNWVA